MKESTVLDASELDTTSIDPDSPVPLYHQIENDLRRMIGCGELPPHAVLPPEKDLCRVYGVSRHTMRKALSRLVADDLISRRAGRGTLVKAQADRMAFYLDRSFTRQMADMGREAHSEVLKLTADTIDQTCPDVFHDKIDHRCLRLVRLRFGDEEPIALQSSVILTELCPDLGRHDFERESLYDVLAREYQLVITKIQHTISAAVSDQFQADLLQVEQGAPLLVVKTTASLEDQQVIESTITYYRADRYEYRTTATYSSC